MSVTAFPKKNEDQWQKRVDLAAAFQWTARLDMHEAVANHFSLIVDHEQKTFLIRQPFCRSYQYVMNKLLNVNIDTLHMQKMIV